MAAAAPWKESASGNGLASLCSHCALSERVSSGIAFPQQKQLSVMKFVSNSGCSLTRGYRDPCVKACLLQGWEPGLDCLSPGREEEHRCPSVPVHIPAAATDCAPWVRPGLLHPHMSLSPLRGSERRQSDAPWG